MKLAIRRATVLGLLLTLCQSGFAQVKYPSPIHTITLTIEKALYQMAYMDIASQHPSGQCILLLHGKNFNGFYWKKLIPDLTQAGYRVIVPDQIGWGRSDHPNIHYSFFLLANNTRTLLDSLGVSQVIVLGHSMGGMLATRFALMFPDRVSRLILEDPIGLEDYHTFVPYQNTDKLYAKELSATRDSYLQYQRGYYPTWDTAYEPYVDAQAQDLLRPDFADIAWSNALTYQMIYEEPVCYEWKWLRVPTLLIVGDADRTIVGKDYLSQEMKNAHGLYPALADSTGNQLKEGKVIILPALGHIPHIQATETFAKTVLNFLR